jgi:polysaccharide biosynthesis protein PslH
MQSRILFVTSRIPYPPREGHQLRSWHLLRAAARDHRVDLLSLQREDDPSVPDEALTDILASFHAVRLPALSNPPAALAAAGRWMRRRQPLLVARYVSSELCESLRERVPLAGLVHLDILPLAGLLPLVPPHLPVVLNEHNVESALLQSRAEIETRSWRRVLLRQQVAALTAFERNACSQVDRVLSCSATDAERLRELAPAADVRVVPNGVDLQYFDGPAAALEDDRSLVFVGQMGWFPNRDGILDFIANTLPLIRRQQPEARLQVIGRHDGTTIDPAQADAVEFTGFIDDLRPRLRQAAVYVVPLRAGSGTRLKLLEAMAMGKAIVSTRIGAEGIDLVDGQSALLADTPQAFASAVCRLLTDRGLRRRLGNAARKLAEREYGWQAIGNRLLAVYDELLATRPSQVDNRPGRLHHPSPAVNAFRVGAAPSQGSGGRMW